MDSRVDVQSKNILMGTKKPATNLAHVYQHTHIAVYLVGFFAIACLFYDSTQVMSSTLGRASNCLCFLSHSLLCAI